MNKTHEKKAPSMRIRNMHIGSHILLIFWSLLVLIPLWLMVSGSLKEKLEVYRSPFGFPETMQFENYVEAFIKVDFLRIIFNTVLAVGISLLAVLVLGSMAAYALAHWQGRWSSALFFFFTFGMMLPIRIATLRLLELVQLLGLHNTIWALVPIYVAMGVPIAVFVITEFVRGISKELTEAALIDGASRFKIYYRITLPLLKPALATVAIYNLVPFWNDLWFPLIFINDHRHYTLLLGVTRLVGQYNRDWNKIMAVLTMSTIPIMVLYLLFSKYFIKGLTAGAVKG